MLIVNLTPDALADVLLLGGHAAAVENFLLTNDEDAPVYPEALVHVEVARMLRERLNFSSIELEATTERLVCAASGRSPGDPDFPDIGRDGKFDIVCWNGFVPQVFVEVKDQISGADDGIVADMLRMQSMLQIVHRWGPRAPHTKVSRYAAVLYFVGKNTDQYKKKRHLASQFIPFANRSVNTTVRNIRRVVDSSRFDLLVKKTRVHDSAKDAPPNLELVGTAEEETVSGSEQLTYCVVCVLRERNRETTVTDETSAVGCGELVR
ncbi:hypothetical protein [Comamonas sp. GB3 AK4-5]|uniref:hypothetical protein n=1 Tax=Comamonas sp. GB3 AK4-5 TaxID=3231487 RepID=UPI00351EDCB4